MYADHLDKLAYIPLPTLDRVGVELKDDIDARKVAKGWFAAFASAAEAGDAQRVASLFVEQSFWKDILALTWDFRTFIGLPKIAKFLEDRLRADTVNARSLKIRDDHFLSLQKPYPDLAWILFFFDFETDIGVASGIIHLIPQSSGEWKGYSVFTNLDDLKGHPERIGALRDDTPWHGRWEASRKKELALEGTQPKAPIVGGGQSGMAVAARLKALGVPSLLIERHAKVGDSWRKRYDTLCLHDPVRESTLLLSI
jgi:hypothetical protein